MSIELVTAELGEVRLSETEYELPAGEIPELETDLLAQDTKVVELLKLLDRYEKLANDELRVHFIDGFLDLSRANYNGLRKYGADSLDLRSYLACSVVGRGESEFKLEDRLAAQQAELKEQKEKLRSAEKETAGSELKKLTEMAVSVDDEDMSNEKSTSVSTSGTEGVLRKRNTQKQSETSVTSESDVSPPAAKAASAAKSVKPVKPVKSAKSDSTLLYKDPINQFGGLVPYQLRSSQKHFKLALADCVELVNLHRRISVLIADIEAA